MNDIDLDFDNVDVRFEGTVVLLYGYGEFGEEGELIQRFQLDSIADVSIDYEHKVFHAKYIGKGHGIENGEIFDIEFYKMVIV